MASVQNTKIWTHAESAVLSRLVTPTKIQAFLDRIPYSTDPVYRCPRRVLHDRKAHCYDGALFAAMALQRLGYPPEIVNLFATENDDEHIIAIYKRAGCGGAIAKSNFVGLRFREAIYRSLRELVMSYFEQYYNVVGEKTLRSYTVPLNVKAFDELHWMTCDETMDVIAQRLDRLRKFPVVTAEMVCTLSPVDKRSFNAGLLGSNPTGLYKP
jgi:hypothetical protein